MIIIFNKHFYTMQDTSGYRSVQTIFIDNIYVKPKQVEVQDGDDISGFEVIEDEFLKKLKWTDVSDADRNLVLAYVEAFPNATVYLRIKLLTQRRQYTLSLDPGIP